MEDNMDCKEARKRFVPFIDDKLSIDELDAFLKHMESCSECMEEYHICYTVIMGTRLLDGELDKQNIHIDSKDKLRSAADYLFKFRILHLEKMILYFMICILIMFL